MDTFICQHCHRETSVLEDDDAKTCDDCWSGGRHINVRFIGVAVLFCLGFWALLLGFLRLMP